MIPRIKGTHDQLDMKRNDYVMDILHQQLALYHFIHIETPILEPVELFKRSLGMHTDVVSKEMFIIEPAAHTAADSQADESNKICLRPEATASTMRAYLQHHIHTSAWKVFSQGPMFRHERPQKGRFRQFNQVSLEIIGAASIMHEIELITLLDRFFSKYLKLDTYVLLINFLGCADDRKIYTQTLKDFLGTISSEKFCAQCHVRQDKNILRIFDCKNPVCQSLYKDAPYCTQHLCSSCQGEWLQLKDMLHIMGVSYQHDRLLVRGLDYYSKTVFEFINESLGAQKAFCSGGRYDGLAQQLGAKEPVPAVGAAIGIERLLMSLELQTNNPIEPPAKTLACIIPLASEQIPLALLVADTLRDQAIAVDVICDISSLKSMMRTAHKICATWSILIGDEEQKTQTVTVKWMHESQQERVLQTELAHYLRSILATNTHIVFIILYAFALDFF